MGIWIFIRLFGYTCDALDNSAFSDSVLERAERYGEFQRRQGELALDNDESRDVKSPSFVRYLDSILSRVAKPVQMSLNQEHHMASDTEQKPKPTTVALQPLQAFKAGVRAIVNSCLECQTVNLANLVPLDVLREDNLNKFQTRNDLWDSQKKGREAEVDNLREQFDHSKQRSERVSSMIQASYTETSARVQGLRKQLEEETLALGVETEKGLSVASPIVEPAKDALEEAKTSLRKLLGVSSANEEILACKCTKSEYSNIREAIADLLDQERNIMDVKGETIDKLEYWYKEAFVLCDNDKGKRDAMHRLFSEVNGICTGMISNLKQKIELYWAML